MKKHRKLYKYSLLSFLAVLILFFLFFGGYSVVYSKKIYRNQYVGDVKLSGKSKTEASELLHQKTKYYLEKPIVLQYGSQKQEFELKPEEIGLQYDIDATASLAWNYGREGNIFKNFWAQLTSVFRSTNRALVYSVDKEAINKKIIDIAGKLDQPEKDYELQYKGGQFALNESRKSGSRIDQEELKIQMLEAVGKTISSISFDTKAYEPKVTDQNARDALKKANQILEAGDLILIHADLVYTIDDDTIGGLIRSEIEGDNLKLVLNEERAKEFVATIARSIDTEPKNAKLAVVEGKTTISEKSVTGKVLDQAQTKIDISNSLFARISGNAVKADAERVDMKVEVKEPEISDEKVANLGIAELIGTGMTDYKGSPANRVHNITIGANALNGVLLKPGEIFSTLKKLGKIDASSGYLEELVIKENRTIPEFGGGLCQVSSTLFRAAMNAGLKITERQSHKYRVSYYEPPVGMDATIYDPAPDFKFENNYNSYIFIQSSIKGTKITFDIYGTKDGRVVETSAPILYDIVDPGPPVMVESDALAAGEKKILEKAHQGASAKFDYKVTKDGKELQVKTFVSKYVPWPEKWLVGKAPAPVATPAQ